MSPVQSVTDVPVHSRPRASISLNAARSLEIREWFEHRKVRSFAKVSGSKGLQVYVPLNSPSSYAITPTLARRVAEELESQRPHRIISRMAHAQRAGKVFIDWSQNAEHKTTVSVYSIRAKDEQPYVSMPVTWAEVEAALTNHDIERFRFTPRDAIARVKERGDLFAPVLRLKQALPEALHRELGLPSVPKSEAVTIRESVSETYRLPRRSGQGGRKLFVVHGRTADYELGLELKGEFRLFRFGKFPTARASKATGNDADGRGLEPDQGIL